MKMHSNLITGENGKQGFTLIELMIALVIFSVGIAGAARMHVAAIAGNMYSMQLTNAVDVAQTQAERLQDIDYTVAQVTDGAADDGAADLLEPGNRKYGTTQRIQNVDYTPSWTVQSVNNDSRLMNVSMQVSWNEKETLKTYKMNFYTGIN
jgi:prepilin-type N-terminal cleavage/methylation domain-containing protein